MGLLPGLEVGEKSPQSYLPNIPQADNNDGRKPSKQSGHLPGQRAPVSLRTKNMSEGNAEVVGSRKVHLPRPQFHCICSTALSDSFQNTNSNIKLLRISGQAPTTEH